MILVDNFEKKPYTGHIFDHDIFEGTYEIPNFIIVYYIIYKLEVSN